MINDIGWQGSFLIITRNIVTGEIQEELVKNRIMDAAVNKLISCLEGDDPDLQIKYMAIGTSTTPLSDNQTQLGNEIFRTPPVTVTTRSATGEETTEFTLLDDEAVGTIEEVGIFCGSTATAEANTGTMLTRILWHRVKTSSEEITFKRVDRVVRA